MGPIRNYPLVTLYITSYNYGRYLSRAIESVLNQTVDCFELIVIDDGSTDDTLAVANRYLHYPSVRVISQNNKGLNVTNNIALRMARGKYIMRLDADDWLDSHAVEILSNALERDPEIGLVFPDYFLVDDDGRVLEQVRRHKFDDVSLLDQPAHGACTMIRCEALRTVGGYDESFRCQDGYDLWIKLIGRVKVANINLPLFYYRQHPSSLSSSSDRILATRSQIVENYVNKERVPLKVFAVIAVRGAGDPASLALRSLGGRTILEWTLEAARRSTNLHGVVVSTPDEEIIEFLRSKNYTDVRIVRRPDRLAYLNTRLDHTLLHISDLLQEEGVAFDALLQLTIESPFRSEQDIDSAIDILNLYNTDCVVSVHPESSIFYQHNGHTLVPLNSSDSLRLEREAIFREVGSMRLLRNSYFQKKEKGLKVTIGHVVLGTRSSFRLTSDFDLALAKCYLAG